MRSYRITDETLTFVVSLALFVAVVAMLMMAWQRPDLSALRGETGEVEPICWEDEYVTVNGCVTYDSGELNSGIRPGEVVVPATAGEPVPFGG